MKLLVLNCYSRNALAVIDALDPSYEVYGGCEHRHSFPLVCPDRFWRHGRLVDIVRYPSPDATPDRFAAEVIQLAKRLGLDGIIPTGTTATFQLARCKQRIESESGARCLVENAESMDRLTDKWTTYDLCRELDIPMPRTALVAAGDQGRASFEGFTCPIVAKPRVSYASKGVEFFSSVDDLLERVASDPATFIDSDGSPLYIAQECVTGRLCDVTAYADKGGPVALLTQDRVVGARDFGGGGIVNRTTDDAELRELASRLLKKIKWHGVMLFDFLRAEDGRPYLLECNPKFWGTTQLTVSAGFNVAQMLVDNMLLGKSLDTMTDYEVGLVYKWFLVDGIASIFSKPRRFDRMFARTGALLKRRGGTRTMTNFSPRWFRHQVGELFNALAKPEIGDPA